MPGPLGPTDGDIFAADHDTLVNPVNCVGVMGKGLALEFKRRFPSMYKAYYSAFLRGQLSPGCMYPIELYHPHQYINPRYILNLTTKKDWRDPSRLEWIDRGMQKVREFVDNEQHCPTAYRRLVSVGIPALGCGLGGLNWADVKPIIEKHMAICDIERVVIYEPRGYR